MFAPVAANQSTAPRAIAHVAADCTCSEKSLATMRSEAIRRKPAERNRAVRIGCSIAGKCVDSVGRSDAPGKRRITPGSLPPPRTGQIDQEMGKHVADEIAMPEMKQAKDQ